MKTTNQKSYTGTVVSTKMQKTAVVRVDTMKMHPLYAKRFVSSKKYKVHDEKGVAKVGDVVEFITCRPISKEKFWRLVKVVTKA